MYNYHIANSLSLVDGIYFFLTAEGAEGAEKEKR